MKAEIIKVDAENRAIGPVASEAASFLMAKNTADFTKNKTPNTKVHIVNSSKANIPHKKLNGKVYHHYSGFPGGRKAETLTQIIEKKGYAEIFRKAVYGMLPSNKLRSLMMNNLNITE